MEAGSVRMGSGPAGWLEGAGGAAGGSARSGPTATPSGRTWRPGTAGRRLAACRSLPRAYLPWGADRSPPVPSASLQGPPCAAAVFLALRLERVGGHFGTALAFLVSALNTAAQKCSSPRRARRLLPGRSGYHRLQTTDLTHPERSGIGPTATGVACHCVGRG